MPPTAEKFKDERTQTHGGGSGERHAGGDLQGKNGSSAPRREETREQAGTTGVREAGSQIAAAMLEAADPHTGEHSDDVELVVEQICKRLSVKGEDREDVLVAARLHDVGKVAIPQEVLQKDGPLDDAEWKLIKKHTVTGERILRSVPELGPAAELVRHSHEHFDGTGYPDGLEGEDIPLGSRIILCADAFHAIRSDRPYRKGRPTRAALKEMHRCSGSQFDPKVVEALDASIKSAKRSRQRRRTLPPRLAILFAMLAIGTGGAFAAERGWIPSPVPGLGPEASNEADGNASGSQAATFTEEGGLSATGNLTGSDDGDVAGTEDASGDAQGDGTVAGGDATPRQGGDGGPASSNEAGGPGAGGSAGAQGGSFGDGGGNGAGGGNDGSTGTADGAGSGAGGGGSPGATGSAGGGGSTGGGAVGGGSSGGGSSGSAPGQSGSTPGQSGTTPGQSGGNPSTGAAPPGQSGTTPGQSGTTPGQSGTTPGASGAAPGQSGTAPGQTGTAPGLSGAAPGQTGSPGNSGSAPGQTGGGRPNAVPGA